MTITLTHVRIENRGLAPTAPARIAQRTTVRSAHSDRDPIRIAIGPTSVEHVRWRTRDPYYDLRLVNLLVVEGGLPLPDDEQVAHLNQLTAGRHAMICLLDSCDETWWPVASWLADIAR